MVFGCVFVWNLYIKLPNNEIFYNLRDMFCEMGVEFYQIRFKGKGIVAGMQLIIQK